MRIIIGIEKRGEVEEKLSSLEGRCELEDCLTVSVLIEGALGIGGVIDTDARICPSPNTCRGLRDTSSSLPV